MSKGEGYPRGNALVYDDNGLVALDTRETLLELGFRQVTIAACGDDAVASLRNSGLHWAVIDAGCPARDLAAVIAALDAAAVSFALVCSSPDGSDIPEQWKGRTYLARPYGKADLERLAPR